MGQEQLGSAKNAARQRTGEGLSVGSNAQEVEDCPRDPVAEDCARVEELLPLHRRTMPQRGGGMTHGAGGQHRDYSRSDVSRRRVACLFVETRCARGGANLGSDEHAAEKDCEDSEDAQLEDGRRLGPCQ